MLDFYQMYGLADDTDQDKSMEEKLKAHEEEIRGAYRNVEGCGIIAPDKYRGK